MRTHGSVMFTLVLVVASWTADSQAGSTDLGTHAEVVRPIRGLGGPIPRVVDFTEDEIRKWRHAIDHRTPPRAFFETVQSSEYQPGAVYVHFRPGTDISAMITANVAAGALDVTWQSQVIPGLMQVSVAPGHEATAIERYLNIDEVAYAEPDYLSRRQETIPNDEFLDLLWGIEDIRAPEAWDYHTGTDHFRIAVIDTGIVPDHEDLQANVSMSLGWNFADNNNDPTESVHDCFGTPCIPCGFHGTHVAGTIAARGNNEIGIVGVNWRATIIPIKVANPLYVQILDAWLCPFVNLPQALEHALLNGARVSNHSYGGPSYNHSLYLMILAAQDYHHIVVAGAGNNGSDNDTTPFYPASFQLDNVISVAWLRQDITVDERSNFGANSVHLGAPGGAIFSTVGPDIDSYDVMGGTSMAAPHVTGAIALLQSANRSDMIYKWFRSRVLDSVQPTPALHGITTTGGRLDLREAMNVYGNFDASIDGSGSKNSPFAKVSSCLEWTPSGFPLLLYPSTTNWTGTIDQPIEIRAVNGTVYIGVQ